MVRRLLRPNAPPWKARMALRSVSGRSRPVTPWKELQTCGAARKRQALAGPRLRRLVLRSRRPNLQLVRVLGLERVVRALGAAPGGVQEALRAVRRVALRAPHPQDRRLRH